MKNSFFAADHHLFHGNIIKYSKRPFSSVEEMNETIIAQHNAVVKPEDDIYFLGDFAFVDSPQEFEKLISRFNRRKFFVIGSHDRVVEKNFHTLRKHFVWIKDKAEIYVNNVSITLCHYPMWSWAKSHYGAWQFFGHHHGSLNNDHRSADKIDLTNRLQIDVGVDCWNFEPASFEQIEEIMKKKNFVPINKRDRNEKSQS